MSTKIDQRPISVTDNITPISHEPVGVLLPHKWESEDVSLEFLNNQMNILQDRYNAAVSMRTTPPQVLASLNNGIMHLNVCINRKVESQD
jgi:hypothetical protein